MSISGSGNEVETAAGRVDVAGNTTEENAIVLEASEDREVHAIQVKNNQANCTSEVSFSNQMLFDTAGEFDEIASGVLAFSQSGGNAFNDVPDSAAPHWEAGEELNVHVDNANSSSALTTIIVYYRPIGDFSRERLRNR